MRFDRAPDRVEDAAGQVLGDLLADRAARHEHARVRRLDGDVPPLAFDRSRILARRRVSKSGAWRERTVASGAPLISNRAVWTACFWIVCPAQ